MAFESDLAFAKVVETPEGPALLIGYRVLRVAGLRDEQELGEICGALRKGCDAKLSSIGQQAQDSVIDGVIRASAGISSGRG